MNKENEITINDNIKVYVMRGFYDERGEYCKEYLEDIPLSELPEKAIPKIDFDYDVSIAYGIQDVLVVAKSRQDLDEYLSLAGKPRFFHSLLNMSYRYDYASIVESLKSLRKSKNRKAKA